MLIVDLKEIQQYYWTWDTPRGKCTLVGKGKKKLECG
jgi:hypothetical protein